MLLPTNVEYQNATADLSNVFSFFFFCNVTQIRLHLVTQVCLAHLVRSSI